MKCINSNKIFLKNEKNLLISIPDLSNKVLIYKYIYIWLIQQNIINTYYIYNIYKYKCLAQSVKHVKYWL